MGLSIPSLPETGEMAGLIRKKDWSKTPLGPIEDWPQSLRSTVDLILNNKFPMMIWWGEEYIQLYNDSSIPIFREKHPLSLGERAQETWSEVWDVIGKLADGVTRGGPSVLMEDMLFFIKNGDKDEESSFTFSYSAIHDEKGSIVGMLTTVHETTPKVLGERRLRMLHDLVARASEAKSEGEAYRVVMNVLSDYEAVTPMALLYKYDEAAGRFHLSGSTGFGRYDGPAKKAESWPLKEVLDTNNLMIIEDIDKRFPALPVGQWGAGPTRAAVLPLSRKASGLEAVMVMAISPHRIVLDESYMQFLDALADQLMAVIVSARAFETEKRRVKELASLDDAKTIFFSNISHEFRTPLTLILGPIEEALARKDLPRDHREQLQLMHRNTLRLKRLVNGLLEFSRLEAGREKGEYEPLELGTYTKELASSFESAFREAGLAYKIDCKPLKHEVFVDYEKWETIVLNLLSNALKYTFLGGVTISLEEKADYVELAVTDTGVGIPKEELPHLFERFHRVTGVEARTVEGTGIGLAIVSELVKLHGGTVKVQSKLEKGTTFSVRIPYGSAHLPKDQVVGRLHGGRTASTTMHTYAEEARGWLKRGDITELHNQGHTKSREDEVILVVDDNADMRNYVSRILDRNTSLTIESVSNGIEALEYIEKVTPSLVVSDIMMPKMDGIELVGKLRKNSKTKNIPIIFLSARASEQQRAEGIVEGVDTYLTKPFSSYELVAVVRTQLDLAELRKTKR